MSAAAAPGRACQACGGDLAGQMAVTVWAADGHGGLQPVPGALRCLPCENALQHPQPSSEH